MAGDSRVGDRQPSILRIKLKYSNVETFIEKYAVNISRGGIFIASRTPKAVGTNIRFEFLLQQGETGVSIIRGEGQVQWIREFDPSAPQRPHGMGLRFTHLDAESQKLIDRALSWQKEHIAPIRRELSGLGTMPDRDKSAPHKLLTPDAPTGVFVTPTPPPPELEPAPEPEPPPLPEPVPPPVAASEPPLPAAPLEATLARVALRKVAVSRTTGQILRPVPQAAPRSDAPIDDTLDLQLAALCADAGLDDAALQGALDRLRALGVSPDTDLATLLT